MKDIDPADLDGDGKFDAIDIVNLEDEEGDNKKTPENNNNGCCFSLSVIVMLASGVAVGLKLYFA